MEKMDALSARLQTEAELSSSRFEKLNGRIDKLVGMLESRGGSGGGGGQSDVPKGSQLSSRRTSLFGSRDRVVPEWGAVS